MNGIQNKKEYAICDNFGMVERPLIETVYCPKGSMIDQIVEEPVIVFVTEGKIDFLSGGEVLQSIDSGKLFLLPSGYRVFFRSAENSCLIFGHIRENIKFFDNVKSYDLRNTTTYKQIDIESCRIYALEINQPIDLFFSCLLTSLKDGLNGKNYLEIKLNELFILINAYYSEDLLTVLFYPLLNEDFLFISQILENRYKVFSVNKMSAILHLSSDDFRLHFKRIFKELPSDWMNRERGKLILQKLTQTDKPLKQISEECGFLFLSYLGRFCKKHLGSTPFKIRSKSISTQKDKKN
jgi:AraC-like DNA-binding protein